MSCLRFVCSHVGGHTEKASSRVLLMRSIEDDTALDEATAGVVGQIFIFGPVLFYAANRTCFHVFSFSFHSHTRLYTFFHSKPGKIKIPLRSFSPTNDVIPLLLICTYACVAAINCCITIRYCLRIRILALNNL
jgi:hypothetical protein